jgi:glycosyltransferase involved in cell wall biosynthesis
LRLLTHGPLPPEWGGGARGGVATFHAALLGGFLAEQEVEVVGVVPPGPLSREPPVPILVRPAATPYEDFYRRLLEDLRPDALLMNHVANAWGLTHARQAAAVPALGVVHSWHKITLRAEAERERAREVTEEALGGLQAVVTGSRHCLAEGRALGLPHLAGAEVIHYPLQPFYSRDDVDVYARERHGVVCLSSLIERKRPEALVEAAALSPDLEVVFAGEGPLEDVLRAKIAQHSLGERVRMVHHFHDSVHLVRVRDLLLGAEVMCLPSRSESFGLVFTEALACGTPVVGFGPTVREIQEELSLDVGEPLDTLHPGEIVGAVDRVRARRWDRNLLRRRTLEVFGLPRATGRYLELLRRLAG